MLSFSRPVWSLTVAEKRSPKKLVMNPLLQCSLIAVLSQAVGAISMDQSGASNKLRRSTPTAKAPPALVFRQQKSKQLPAAPSTGDIPSTDDIPGRENIPDIPGTPLERAKERRVMDAINKFRAEICYQMKKEHNKKFKTFEDCSKFMEEACNPGKDKLMDGDRKEVSSGEGFCEEYFPKAEKKAREQIEKEDREEEERKKKAPCSEFKKEEECPSRCTWSGDKCEATEIVAPAPAPAAVSIPAPAPEKVEKKEEEKKEEEGGAAPAPAPASSPSGASPAAPGTKGKDFIPGKHKGKPAEIAEDEAWYYKKDGKDMKRLHMDAELKLPTQGYWGKLIEHEDMETMTGDWGKEFGPGTHKTLQAVCAEHPNNPWCADQGLVPGGRHHRSASSPLATYVIVPLVLAFATLLN